jgi:hypothetical protein
VPHSVFGCGLGGVEVFGNDSAVFGSGCCLAFGSIHLVCFALAWYPQTLMPNREIKEGRLICITSENSESLKIIENSSCIWLYIQGNNFGGV